MSDQVTCLETLVALPVPPAADMLARNPLGKIPALTLEDETTVIDSRVICEYLDRRAGAGLFPDDPEARLRQLNWQALGDGLADILLIWRTELTRPTGPWEKLTAGWLAKVRATIARLDNDAGELTNTPFGIGQIAVVCALGQLDFRWPDTGWRERFPKLAGFDAAMADRPSIVAIPAPKDADPQAGAVTRGHLVFDA